MNVLAVKIHNSVDGFFKERERASIMECTQMWWRCSKDKRKEVEYIIGIKDETIYSAFKVVGFKEVKESHDETRIGRTIFICGESIDEIIGATVKESKNRSPLKYYDSEELFKQLKLDKDRGKWIMDEYKRRGILYR